MSKFDELKQALTAKSDSYSKNIAMARKLVNAALRTFKDEEGEQIKGHLTIDEHRIGEDRAAVRILVDEHPVFALWYAKDGDLGIDLNPTNTDSNPITLHSEDSEEFSSKIDDLINLAKNADESNKKDSCPKQDIMDKIANDYPELKKLIDSFKGEKVAKEEDEEEFLQILVKIVNSIKDLDGPKYDDLNAFWRNEVTMINNGKERLIVIAERSNGTIAITNNVMAGPSSLVTVSGKVGELAQAVVKLVRENLDNKFKDPNNMFETLTKLLDAMPARMRADILEDMLKNLL